MTDPSLQEIIACLGYPVAGNPTQFVMERAFQAAGFDSRCLTIDVAPEDLPAAISGMRAMDFRGGIIDTPHHRDVGPLVDRLTPAAEVLGEADLIYRDEEGTWWGDNSCVHSVTELLAEQIDIEGKRVVILGTGPLAGGAALAVGRAKAAHITLVASDDIAGDSLTRRLQEQIACSMNVQTWPDLYCIPAETDVVIQATFQGGTYQEPLAVDLDSLHSGMVLLDSVFNPSHTHFLERGNAADCITIDGLSLLVQRAVVAFRWWTKRDPDRAVLTEAFEEFLML